MSDHDFTQPLPPAFRSEEVAHKNTPLDLNRVTDDKQVTPCDADDSEFGPCICRPHLRRCICGGLPARKP